jgi:cellulose synthase/poly-beta-1,6-N-acetylglucosamine synthase-like glycosyltransferase
MIKAKLSVIIPTYRSKETIDRCILSVINQSLQPSEIIVIDDGSNDGTTFKIQKLFDILRPQNKEINFVEIFLNNNSGPSTARNIGWNAAKFEYIAFLDSDDAWDPSKILIQYKFMIENPGIDLTCTLSKNFLKLEMMECPKTKIIIKKLFFTSQLVSNRVVTSSVMLKKDIVERFLDGKKYSEDNLLWLEILRAGYSVRRIERILTYSFKESYGSGGLTDSLINMWHGQIDTYLILYRNRKINFFVAFCIFVLSTLKFLIRVIIYILRKK